MMALVTSRIVIGGILIAKQEKNDCKMLKVFALCIYRGEQNPLYVCDQKTSNPA